MLFTFVSGERACDPTLSVSGSEAIAAEFVPGQAPQWLWEVALLVGGSGQLLHPRFSVPMYMQNICGAWEASA